MSFVEGINDYLYLDDLGRVLTPLNCIKGFFVLKTVNDKFQAEYHEW